MITRFVRLFVVLLLLVVAVPTPAARGADRSTTAAGATTQHPAEAVNADAVVMVDVVDVSGSLSKAIAAMSDAETRQLTTSLRPGDIYARVVFDGTGRVAMLMPVREPADVGRITTVLKQNVAAAGRYTSIAAGLAAAREVVEKERGSRRVVLAVLTDGVLDPADGLVIERQRLTALTTWWKNQPWATRIVVSVKPNSTNAAIVELAKALDAELVALGDYAKTSVVARAITVSRTTPPATPTAAPAMTSWPHWIVGPASLGVLGFIVWMRRRAGPSPAARRPMAEAVMVTVPLAKALRLTTTVTANGRAQDTAIDVATLDGGAVTLGTEGAVNVPGLQGRPVTVEVDGEELSISVEPGFGIRVNGETIDDVPQPMRVGRTCRLSHRGVAIALQLHRGDDAAARPARVVGFGRAR